MKLTNMTETSIKMFLATTNGTGDQKQNSSSQQAPKKTRHFSDDHVQIVGAYCQYLLSHWAGTCRYFDVLSS